MAKTPTPLWSIVWSASSVFPSTALPRFGLLYSSNVCQSMSEPTVRWFFTVPALPWIVSWMFPPGVT